MSSPTPPALRPPYLISLCSARQVNHRAIGGYPTAWEARLVCALQCVEQDTHDGWLHDDAGPFLCHTPGLWWSTWSTGGLALAANSTYSPRAELATPRRILPPAPYGV